MFEPETIPTSVEETAKPVTATIDFASIAAMFDDDEQPAPVCDLENPESCEACQ
jgi:hypothetical protein